MTFHEILHTWYKVLCICLGPFGTKYHLTTPLFLAITTNSTKIVQLISHIHSLYGKRRRTKFTVQFFSTTHFCIKTMYFQETFFQILFNRGSTILCLGFEYTPLFDVQGLNTLSYLMFRVWIHSPLWFLGFEYIHLFEQSSLLWSNPVGAQQLRAKALRRRALLAPKHGMWLGGGGAGVQCTSV